MRKKRLPQSYKLRDYPYRATMQIDYWRTLREQESVSAAATSISGGDYESSSSFAIESQVSLALQERGPSPRHASLAERPRAALRSVGGSTAQLRRQSTPNEADRRSGQCGSGDGCPRSGAGRLQGRSNGGRGREASRDRTTIRRATRKGGAGPYAAQPFAVLSSLFFVGGPSSSTRTMAASSRRSLERQRLGVVAGKPLLDRGLIEQEHGHGFSRARASRPRWARLSGRRTGRGRLRAAWPLCLDRPTSCATRREGEGLVVGAAEPGWPAQGGIPFAEGRGGHDASVLSAEIGAPVSLGQVADVLHGRSSSSRRRRREAPSHTFDGAATHEPPSPALRSSDRSSWAAPLCVRIASWKSLPISS